MKILVIGGGGREHAIIRKLKESPKVEKLYCAPGNGGISKDAECVAISAMDLMERSPCKGQPDRFGLCRTG